MTEMWFSVHSDMDNIHIIDMHIRCKFCLLPLPRIFTSEWNAAREEILLCMSFGIESWLENVAISNNNED